MLLDDSDVRFYINIQADDLYLHHFTVHKGKLKGREVFTRVSVLPGAFTFGEGHAASFITSILNYGSKKKPAAFSIKF